MSHYLNDCPGCSLLSPSDLQRLGDIGGKYFASPFGSLNPMTMADYLLNEQEMYHTVLDLERLSNEIRNRFKA